MMRVRYLFVAVAVLAVSSGCKCGGPVTNNSKPEYVPTPTALSFEACPTKDANGQLVKDVYPDTRKVTINNQGKVSAGLALTISGKDAAAFKLAPGAPTTIDSLGQVEVSVLFSPEKSIEHSALLTIDDGTDGTNSPTVTLAGTGINLPAQPTIETAPQMKDGTGFLLCQEGATGADCTLEFPDTLFNQTNTLQLKIRNKGCPALKITGLGIESNRGDTQGFSIDSPAQLPSATSPILLSTADGTQETTITVRFAPTDDGSGDPLRLASLVITSNDPNYGTGGSLPARIQLQANAVKPSIYVTPGICDFSNAGDLCGYLTKTANKAQFRVTNDGQTAVQIETTHFRSTGNSTSGVSGRFSITGAIEGQTLQPAQSATLEVTHTDQPLYVSDQIDVVAKMPGQPSGSGGKITLALYGGLKPCLITDPLDTVNFENPTTDLSAQTLHVKNGPGCGTLTINALTVDANPFFSIIDPVIAPGSTIAAGAELTTTVQYKRPASGGMQLGTLRLETNDSDFGAPQFKIVQLTSNSPLDQIPVAALTLCTPTQIATDPTCAMGSATALSVQYASITPKEITLSGVTSYDPDPASPGGKKSVAKYKFRLLGPFAPGVTSANLAQNDVQITSPTTVLSIPVGGIGNYRVQLIVYDDRMQASANSTVLNISVY